VVVDAGNLVPSDGLVEDAGKVAGVVIAKHAEVEA